MVRAYFIPALFIFLLGVLWFTRHVHLPDRGPASVDSVNCLNALQSFTNKQRIASFYYKDSPINLESLETLTNPYAVTDIDTKILKTLIEIRREHYFDHVEPYDLLKMKDTFTPNEKEELLDALKDVLKAKIPQEEFRESEKIISKIKALRKSTLDEPAQALAPSTTTKEVYIGVDLGGTKIAVGAINASEEGEKVLIKKKVPTFPDGEVVTDETKREAFMERMAQEILEVVRDAEEAGYKVNTTVGFGSPGLLKEGVITAGTVQQLGEAFFDYNIEKGLEKYLKKFKNDFTVNVNNDALAQLAYGIHSLAKDDTLKRMIVGEKVAFIGPGTSLGGGFAHVRHLPSGQLETEFFTDGHIFDILIEDSLAKEGENPMALAHDLLSGRFFQQKLGKSGKEVAEELKNPMLRHQVHGHVKEAGGNLGKIIEAIHTGSFAKPLAHTPWDNADKIAVKNIDVFILGGTIGTEGEMGQIIQREAMKYLRKQGYYNITLLPLSESSADAAIIGAASFAGLKNLVP